MKTSTKNSLMPAIDSKTVFFAVEVARTQTNSSYLQHTFFLLLFLLICAHGAAICVLWCNGVPAQSLNVCFLRFYCFKIRSTTLSGRCTCFDSRIHLLIDTNERKKNTTIANSSSSNEKVNNYDIYLIALLAHTF